MIEKKVVEIGYRVSGSASVPMPSVGCSKCFRSQPRRGQKNCLHCGVPIDAKIIGVVRGSETASARAQA